MASPIVFYPDKRISKYEHLKWFVFAILFFIVGDVFFDIRQKFRHRDYDYGTVISIMLAFVAIAVISFFKFLMIVKIDIVNQNLTLYYKTIFGIKRVLIPFQNLSYSYIQPPYKEKLPKTSMIIFNETKGVARISYKNFSNEKKSIIAIK